MALNILKQQIKDFELKAGFDKTKINDLLKMLQEEMDILKTNVSNKKIVDHKLLDIQVLILQIANRFDTDLDTEWKNQWKKKDKYLKRNE